MATELDSLSPPSADVHSQRIVTSSVVVPPTAKRHIEESKAVASIHGRKRAVDEADAPRQLDNDVTMSGSVDNGGQRSSVTRASESEVVKRPRLDTTNPDVRKRGQRMFANILGTLTKFKNESQHKSEAEIKREQIEQKLQEKLKRERDELSIKMRKEDEDKKAKAIEQKKMEEEKRLNLIRNTARLQKSYLANYILTDAQPRLYYLPAKATEDMKRQIESQRAEASRQIREEEERDRERERDQAGTMEVDGGGKEEGEVVERETKEGGEDVEMNEREEERDGKEKGNGNEDVKKEDEGVKKEEDGGVKKEEDGDVKKEEDGGVKEEDGHVKKEKLASPSEREGTDAKGSSAAGEIGGDVVDYEVEDADEESK
ncbi:pinin/SDK/memA/ protein conserved region-domain-containing protein [Jimgerdemannia flammicorona]|uniref:Pinin/SDK/memA/ protein conserved region-domain-containing protein n=1 Tax=Jimgerdemannia flammicorona TaxID=994334 RepID=A0A433Q372_9FUNG|nr:pinin/SDK/memA/ protein conserved region-domain-containing protein [Jimgerdemannia flammicorona]